MSRRIPAACAVLCLGFQTALAQSGTDAVRAPSVQDDGDVVELQTTLVEVPVIVSEPGGRYVTGLRQSDFRIFEDGVEQEIDVFSSVDEPFHVALMIDTSGSTRDQLERIKDAASAFLDQLRPHDRVAILSFEDEVKVLTPLTSDRTRLRSALRTLTPGQYTQVYEAMHTVASEIFTEVEGRKAAILFSDGVDTASAIATFDDSLAEISNGQVIVYPIRYNTRPDVEARLAPRPAQPDPVKQVNTAKDLAQAYHVADAYLYSLADRTGGVLHRADSLADLPAAFARIAAELRHQYLIGYYPAKRDGEPASHRISVTVTRPDLLVRARESYQSQARPKR